jgi:hypothetical protein
MARPNNPGPYDINVEVRDLDPKVLRFVLPDTFNDVPKEHVFFAYTLTVQFNTDPQHPKAVPWPQHVAYLWFGVKTTKEQRLEAIRNVADLCRMRFGVMA